jgi:hypothetical protein
LSDGLVEVLIQEVLSAIEHFEDVKIPLYIGEDYLENLTRQRFSNDLRKTTWSLLAKAVILLGSILLFILKVHIDHLLKDLLVEELEDFEDTASQSVIIFKLLLLDLSTPCFS